MAYKPLNGLKRWWLYRRGCTPYNIKVCGRHIWKQGSTGSTPGGCFRVVWLDPEENYVWGHAV